MNLRKIDSEYILYTILIGGSTFLFFRSFSFDQKAHFLREGTVLPGYWPRLILSGIFILTMILLIIKIDKNKALKGETLNKEKTLSATGRFVSLVFLCFLYVNIMTYIGFLVGTVVFTFLVLLLLNYRKPILLILYPLFMTTLIFLIFIKLLSMSLPRGVGIFYSFSKLFY